MAESKNDLTENKKKRPNKLTNARIKKEIEFLEKMFVGVDDENKSITWNDGSKSLYGQRITLFDRLKPYIVFGIIGSMILYAIFVDWRIKRNLKRKNSEKVADRIH